MTNYHWNKEKNEQLRQKRGVCFEDVIDAIANNQVLGVIGTANLEKYPNQSIMVVEIRGYVYCVPFVKDGSVTFLKTIFPSRKMKKQFLGRQTDE
jgi:uncharacterized DUF497 family protein